MPANPRGPQAAMTRFELATKSWRRVGVAGAAIAALALGVLAPPAAHADPVPDDPNLILHYDFSSPGAVTDITGNGNNGTLLGTGATVADGVLTLPGGASNSGAGYVRFPANLFDGKDTLTISTWLRNETAAGNYAAMFFGSAANPPSQYWLLNPRNPQSRFKTVVTNGSAPSAPWGTEYGISPTNAAQGVAGPTTGTAWGMYTTVITPTSISGYYNGTHVGTVATSRTVTQFGTGLVGYIGRSSYPDVFYKGGVDDVIVSTSAYTPAQIADLYHLSERTTPAQTQAALAADADAVSLPDETIANLALPASGANLSRITWSSSAPEVIAADGTVTRPAAGPADATVTLTGTFSLGGETLTRAYEVTVPAIDAQRDLERSADAFDLGIEVVTSDIVLRDSIDDIDVSWASSAPSLLSATGDVTRPVAETDVDLTATFSREGLTTERTYRVTVKAQDAGRAVAYVRTGGTAKTEVLHLAIGADGDPLVALNNNKGVLYPTFGTGTSQFANPTLFRKPDGTFGLVAADNAANGRIFVYTSKDLVTFTGQKLATTNTQGITVARADVAYDNGIRAYRVVLHTPAGAAYEVTTRDFTTFSTPQSISAPAAPTLTGLPAGAIEASALPLTAAELALLQKSLGRIVNTTVDAGDDVEVEVGGDLELPEKVQLGYSDGSSKQLGVNWDTSGVDVETPGEYTVTGTVNQPVYGDSKGILVPERADPWVFRDDERTGEAEYYLTGSYPTTQASPGVGYDRIVLRRASTINGLTTAQEQVLLWSRNAAAPNTANGSKIATGAYRYFWAPELHKINGDWYILFTSSRSTDVWNIRPAIMRAPGDSDPMVASNWEELGYVKAAPGDTSAFTSFSLDMTYFEANGKHYMVWAEKPGSSDLRMAEIDPANPSQLITPSILLSTPNYAWERTASQVINEGAAVIKSDDEVFVFFSASEVNETYSIGMLRAPIDGDLMKPSTWAKTGYPLLTSDDFGGQQNGPGHNSFTLDADGNPVIVYHARPPISEWIPGADGGLNDPSRHARVKTVHFAADGSAVLNQTREEEVAPANRTVSLQITVVGPELDVSGVVASRCVAGKVVQVITVTNGEAFPVTLTATSPYGTKAFGSVAAGKSASASFTTRALAVPDGSVALKAVATVGGLPVTVDQQVTYPAASCG
ncbi:family 43 glycosylhydrolase [Microbacterium sp. CFH 31415]|uniref:family 43 glycosylhydrolase n=1 Tax=Microbacterium sp. CFH 31415 TaxID=2921732 RepID=UPI001F1429DB|nr:family 43 glycosylhydrolase [Microbacterium sp. CFH 31415]MCH6231175.1 family 43 glycosylhydrolase [Microbacterium sp. CFH 31415]